MKTLYTFVLLLCVTTLVAQTDTLIIAHKKYPLQKTKVYYKNDYNFPVELPIEYTLLNREVRIEYSRQELGEKYITIDADGNQITTKIISPDITYEVNGTVYLQNFLDTIYVTNNDYFNMLIGIKSKGKLYPMCSSKVYSIYDSVLTKSNYINGGDQPFIYDSNFSGNGPYETKMRKATTYIIKELYYRRGNATYYLNRQFIILVK